MSDLTEHDDVLVVDTPATFHFKTDTLPFVVKDVGAWGYMDNGYFALGRWSDQGNEVNVIIPYDNVAYIVLDFDALAEASADELLDSLPPVEDEAA